MPLTWDSPANDDRAIAAAERNARIAKQNFDALRMMFRRAVDFYAHGMVREGDWERDSLMGIAR